MIVSFRHKGLKPLFTTGDRSGVSAGLAERLENLLSALDAATSIEQFELPAYRVHALSGDLKGYWSAKVNANWRLIFQFRDGEASNLDLVDYH